MLYLDTGKQIIFLITVCFSSCILFLALCFRNAKFISRLLGLAFFIPAFLQIMSFISTNESITASLSEAAEPLLFLVFFLLLAVKPPKKNFNAYWLLLWSISPLVYLIDINNAVFRNFLSAPANSMLPLIVLLVSNLYLLKNERGSKSLLFWALLAMAAGRVSGVYLSGMLWEYLEPALLLTAYILFIKYFYEVFISEMLHAYEENAKRLSTLNRSIDSEVKKRLIEIERVNQNLVNVAKTDPLTKVYNKIAILGVVENAIRMKPESEFSILMFDIDEFKSINDTIGHMEGDKCLKSLALAVRRNFREFDVVGRYGGDEFVVMLPGTNIEQALHVAERFRKNIERTDTPHYTISIGIAVYPEDGATAKELITAADKGLYKSKAKGRNAVSYRDIY